MYTQNDFFLLDLARQKIQERIQEAETYRLIRQARQVEGSHPAHGGPIVRLGCRGLACLGALLIAIGRRLLRIAAAHGRVILIDAPPRGSSCEYT